MHDVLVVGGGIAGLRAAVAAKGAGASVALVTQSHPARSFSVTVQDGINAPESAEGRDSHISETLAAGAGLNVPCSGCQRLPRGGRACRRARPDGRALQPGRLRHRPRQRIRRRSVPDGLRQRHHGPRHHADPLRAGYRRGRGHLRGVDRSLAGRGRRRMRGRCGAPTRHRRGAGVPCESGRPRDGRPPPRVRPQHRIPAVQRLRHRARVQGRSGARGHGVRPVLPRGAERQPSCSLPAAAWCRSGAGGRQRPAERYSWTTPRSRLASPTHCSV